MSRKKPSFLLSLALALWPAWVVLLASCTEQSRAHQFGGNVNINLPKGSKLVNVTWEGQGHLWYLVEPMAETDEPRTLVLHESSSWGVMQGTVTFVEAK